MCNSGFSPHTSWRRIQPRVLVTSHNKAPATVPSRHWQSSQWSLNDNCALPLSVPLYSYSSLSKSKVSRQRRGRSPSLSLGVRWYNVLPTLLSLGLLSSWLTTLFPVILLGDSIRIIQTPNSFLCSDSLHLELLPSCTLALCWASAHHSQGHTLDPVITKLQALYRLFYASHWLTTNSYLSSEPLIGPWTQEAFDITTHQAFSPCSSPLPFQLNSKVNHYKTFPCMYPPPLQRSCFVSPTRKLQPSTHFTLGFGPPNGTR